MTPGRGREKVRAMTPSIPKRLVVELDYDGEGNIAGRVLDAASDRQRDFAGWLGLAGAIEQLASAGAQGREAA